MSPSTGFRLKLCWFLIYCLGCFLVLWERWYGREKYGINMGRWIGVKIGVKIGGYEVILVILLIKFLWSPVLPLYNPIYLDKGSIKVLTPAIIKGLVIHNLITESINSHLRERDIQEIYKRYTQGYQGLLEWTIRVIKGSADTVSQWENIIR